MASCKYIFVTGGVVSGLGKGITAASLGRLLINRGLNVTIQKLDPYINVDPGTMNPYEHGEVFVTDDGAETDLDIGHYERFMGRNFYQNNNCTAGRIYNNVIQRERIGDYLGKTIQVIPHITNEIKDTMRSVAKGNDIVIVEVGGTVGDIEGMAFIEAIRQFRKELGEHNSVSIHVTLVPYLECSGEIKTKPTQASVREAQQMGLIPDIIVCRTTSAVSLEDGIKSKLAMFCNLDGADCVIHNYDCRSIYEVPLVLKSQKFDDIVLSKLKIKAKTDNMSDWKKMVEGMLAEYPAKTVAIVGKYTMVPDAYLSVIEAVKHAGFNSKVGIQIKLVDSEHVEKYGADKVLDNVDAIVVPGGFGNRGIEGKIATIKYARENGIPFLGLCLGMQMAVIEFARNVLGLKDANSSEINPQTPHPVITIMDDQKNITEKGGTMRLGLYDCALTPNTKTAKLYAPQLKPNAPAPTIKERHRHRYEFNNAYREQFATAGLVFSGINKKLDLVEIIELPNHPYFAASQFHPELVSRPYRPHPLFMGLIAAAAKRPTTKKEETK